MSEVTDNAGNDLIVAALKDTCILCSLRFTRLGVVRTDKGASRDVTSEKGAAAGSAMVQVNRLAGADEFHRRILSAQHDARKALYDRTTPYGSDDTWRILPNAEFMPALADYKGAKEVCDQAVADMIADLPNIVSRAKAAVGSFDVAPPTEEEIKDAYSMTLEFRPVPDGLNFRNLPPGAADALAKRLDERVAAAGKDAVRHAMRRVHEKLSFFAGKLDAYQQREEALIAGESDVTGGYFRDNIVSDLAAVGDFIRTFAALDERIDEIRAGIERIVTDGDGEPLAADDLRRSEEHRIAARDDARELAARVAAYMEDTR